MPTTPPAPPPPPTDKGRQGTGTSGTSGTSGRGKGGKSSQAKAKPKSPPRPRQSQASLQSRLEEFFAAPSLLFSFAEGKESYPAQIIAVRTPIMAEAWADLAAQNAGVRRILEKVTTGGAWGMVTLSTLAVVVPIAQYYGMVPGHDPFALFFGEVSGAPADASRPIVPPPPAPAPPSAPPVPAPDAGEGAAAPAPGPASISTTNGAAAPPPPPVGATFSTEDDYTPPLKPGEPPGVVTVAGTGAVVSE